jgi:hypothetical protein
MIFFLINFNLLAKNTNLITPGELEIKELNKNEKEKLQSTEYHQTVGIPENQYKGSLRFTEGEEEIYLKDIALFFGIGMRMTSLRETRLEASSIPERSPNTDYFFNSTSSWNYDLNYNYFISTGFYWRNGIRIEFEYSPSVFTTKNYANGFGKMKESNSNKETVFNQYLQTSGIFSQKNYKYNDEDKKVTILSDNVVPFAELSVKTFMINLILEKSLIKAKVKPYIGFGAGFIQTDFTNLVTENNKNKLPGIQAMVGFSYPLAENKLNLYVGYKGVMALGKFEYSFSRITGVGGYTELIAEGSEVFHNFEDGIYYDPFITEVTETYSYISHNIDIGFRFYF